LPKKGVAHYFVEADESEESGASGQRQGEKYIFF
jgi:hypothetical protein